VKIAEMAWLQNQANARLLDAALEAAVSMPTLDNVAAVLEEMLPGWFVYRGGSHVAVHLDKGSDQRVLMIVEDK